MVPNRLRFLRSSGLRAMTLVEVTVVIATLIGISGLAFIGGSSFKEGANRALCIHNAANVQKAMRSYCNFQQIEPEQKISDLRKRIMTDSDFFPVEPRCPSGGIYTYLKERVPNIGTPFIRCSIPDHAPRETYSW